MSSKKEEARKRQKQQQKIGLIALLVSGILLIAAGAFLVFQKDSSYEATDGTPALAVDQEIIDYGNQHFNEMISFEITVTNTGDGTLRFTEDPFIEVREGC